MFCLGLFVIDLLENFVLGHEWEEDTHIIL
jgi:hypothetical protein